MESPSLERKVLKKSSAKPNSGEISSGGLSPVNSVIACLLDPDYKHEHIERCLNSVLNSRKKDWVKDLENYRDEIVPDAFKDFIQLLISITGPENYKYLKMVRYAVSESAALSTSFFEMIGHISTCKLKSSQVRSIVLPPKSKQKSQFSFGDIDTLDFCMRQTDDLIGMFKSKGEEFADYFAYLFGMASDEILEELLENGSSFRKLKLIDCATLMENERIKKRFRAPSLTKKVHEMFSDLIDCANSVEEFSALFLIDRQFALVDHSDFSKKFSRRLAAKNSFAREVLLDNESDGAKRSRENRLRERNATVKSMISELRELRAKETRETEAGKERAQEKQKQTRASRELTLNEKDRLRVENYEELLTIVNSAVLRKLRNEAPDLANHMVEILRDTLRGIGIEMIGEPGECIDFDPDRHEWVLATESEHAKVVEPGYMLSSQGEETRIIMKSVVESY